MNEVNYTHEFARQLVIELKAAEEEIEQLRIQLQIAKDALANLEEYYDHRPDC